MIAGNWFWTTALLFVAIALIAIAAWLLLGAWTASRARRLRAGQPTAFRHLAEALHGADPAPALAALARLSREGRIATLTEMASTVAGEQRRALDRIARPSGVLDQARRWARSRRWDRRFRAAKLLGLFGDGTEVEGEGLLGDRNPDVAGQATYWAARYPTAGRTERLVAMLDDEHAGLRFRAEEALVAVGRESVRAVARKLAKPPGRGTLDALRVARRLAVPDFLGPALALCASDDPGVRSAAAALVAAIGGVEAGAMLDRLLDDVDPEVRCAAVRGLGHLARWRSAAAVDRLLDDPDWRLRHEAAVALRRMGPTGELLLRRRAQNSADAATSSARSALELAPFEVAMESEAAA